LQRAELILRVLDASQPFTEEDAQFLQEFDGKKTIIVCNKIDLPRRLGLPLNSEADGEVCCLTGKGMETLKDSIKQVVWSGEIQAEMLES